MKEPSRRAAVLVFVLALALGLASTLGFVHRVLHAPGGVLRGIAAQAVSATAQGAPGTQARQQAAKSPNPLLRGGLLALFGVHADADCRLYDQLAGGTSVPTVPPVVLPATLPAATFAYFLGEVLARWATLFDARGPPVTR